MGTTVTVACKLPHGLHLDHAGKRVTVNGANTSNVIGGHGLTEGIDKEFFDEWLKANADHPAVKNKLIFAHDKARNAAAQAREQASNKTGVEPIDPNKPGHGVQIADEQKERQAGR